MNVSKPIIKLGEKNLVILVLTTNLSKLMTCSVAVSKWSDENHALKVKAIVEFADLSTLSTQSRTITRVKTHPIQVTIFLGPFWADVIGIKFNFRLEVTKIRKQSNKSRSFNYQMAITNQRSRQILVKSL